MNTVLPESVGVSSSRLERIQTALQSFVDQGKLPGAVTMVARRGQVIHTGCFGWQDIEVQKPMQIDTLFPIFSMTKPVTAVAMMILYEEGRFQLYDPLSKFIPEFKNVQVISKTTRDTIELTSLEREITIRDLLTQTSGLFYDEAASTQIEKLVAEAGLFRPDISLEEHARKMVKLPLNHQPGKGWRYGESPEVLGYLVELLSGMPLDVFLHKRIFEPLGMADTSFGMQKDQQDRLARLYGFSKTGSFVEKVEFSPWLVPSNFPRGGFGLISTAPDYLRFAQMLLNKGELDQTRILGRKTVEYMTRNHLPEELLPIKVFNTAIPGYGYGFLMGVMIDSIQAGLLGSEGEFYWGGLSTIFWIDPKEELIALLMTRVEWPNHVPAYQDFRTLVYQALVD